MTDNPKGFLEVALQAVKKAEPIFLKHFGKASGVSVKKGTVSSLVSDADKEIEKLLVQEISGRFSEHAIVGEEFPARKGSAPFTWYIDPIDGTTNYIHGLPHCSISVGLFDADGPLLGIVSEPVIGNCYVGVRGGGATKNGAAIQVSSRGVLKECLGAVGWSDPAAGIPLLQRVAPQVYRVRSFGSAALELCFVASGALDFHIGARVSIWDIAGALPILSEAGGAATEWNGQPMTPESHQIAASNGTIHQEFLELIPKPIAIQSRARFEGKTAQTREVSAAADSDRG